jgi:hypothetical protein
VLAGVLFAVGMNRLDTGNLAPAKRCSNSRQPLVLGAIGLAVGAAVAGAFSTSDFENEWVGEVSDSVKEDLNARAGAVSQSVREASDTLEAELDDIGSEALERLQDTGRNAMDAPRGKLKA